MTQAAPAHFRPALYGRRFSDDTAPASGTKIWMLSFTDIMALMLTFFVMTFAMSDPDDQKVSDFMQALRGQISVAEGPLRTLGPHDVLEIRKVTLRHGLDLQYLKTLLDTQIAAVPALARVQIAPHEDGLILALPHDLLFAPGKNTLQADGAAAVRALAHLLRGLKNRIEIVGHTDPRAVRALKPFESNWGLSLARARAVDEALRANGYTRSSTVRGASSARYDSLSQTLPESERLKYARRVDIVIVADDGKVLPRLGQ